MILLKVFELKFLIRIVKILCGSLHRHPNYDMSDFMVYIESTLKNLANENKEVYICGDFNIDLLKLNDIENYHIFLYFA